MGAEVEPSRLEIDAFRFDVFYVTEKRGVCILFWMRIVCVLCFLTVDLSLFECA